MPLSVTSPLWAFSSVFGDQQSSQGTAFHSASSSSASMPSRPATGCSDLFHPVAGERRESASTMGSSLDSSPILTSPISHPRQSNSKTTPFSGSFPTLPGIDRVESPNKKMRNMKNLSVNTNTAHRSSTTNLAKLAAPLGTAVPAIPPSPHVSSAPPSPAFILPSKPPRRTPSNLGLSLTTADSPRRESARPSLTLQTPIVGLSHSISEPMLIPPELDSPGPIKKQTLEHVKEEMDYEIPLSQEVKSPAYPEGPVCIYEPNIFLYLEPNDGEARQFDVILNVAREVKSPFERPMADTTSGKSSRDQGTQTFRSTADKGVQVPCDKDLQEPLTAITRDQLRMPEYVHVPWDHNTNVVDDLLALCGLIESRTQQHKRVLVHCQCGVSRSASLLVAYGLYQNPRLSVQEAYDVVKKRSRWIGPNMNLIYQLAEFKSLLMRNAGLTPVLPRDQSRTLSLCQGPNVTASSSVHPGSAAIISREEKAAIVSRPRASTRSEVGNPPLNFSMPFAPSRVRKEANFDALSPKTDVPRPFDWGALVSLQPEAADENLRTMADGFEQLRAQSPLPPIDSSNPIHSQAQSETLSRDDESLAPPTLGQALGPPGFDRGGTPR